MASLRLFLAIVIAMDLDLCHLDIGTAFLYAPIIEDVNILQPLGFSGGTSKVCHLNRCLYGLKQSPREFNMLLRDWLVSNGWQQCFSDPCIYIFRTGSVFAMIAMYVDDIPAACNDMA
jgi:ATP-binding cassette subfamily B (MDR/TAP) protein 1